MRLPPPSPPSPPETHHSPRELQPPRAASTFTPWFRLIAESFLYKWWDALLASRTDPAHALDAKALIPLVDEARDDMAQIIRM